MLVLTRSQNESVVIGKDIRVRVIEIQGSKVKLGFDAPNHVRILRDELMEEGTQLTRLDHRFIDMCNELSDRKVVGVLPTNQNRELYQDKTDAELVYPVDLLGVSNVLCKIVHHPIYSE